MNSQARGFTLIELLVSVVIFSLLLAYAVPSLRGSISKSRALNEVRYLSLLIHKARHEAVMRRARVRICPLGQQNQCTSSWNLALTMFVDNNNNKSLDTGEHIIKQADAVLKEGVKRKYSRSSIYFRADGLAWGNNGSLIYCFDSYQYQYIKVVIAATGRIRLTPIVSGAKARVECGKIR